MEAKINADGEKNQSVGMSVEEAETDFGRNKNKVIDLLIQSVLNVDCSIPRTLRGDFSELDAEWWDSLMCRISIEVKM